MRAVGWVLFAGTCVVCVAQAIMLSAATDSLLSYEVVVGLGFPMLAIGSVVGAAVGALIISRYPRSAVGWLFCLGQLGNALRRHRERQARAPYRKLGARDRAHAVALALRQQLLP